MTTLELMQRAAACKGELAQLGAEEKNKALLAMAEALEEQTEEILSANERDMAASQATPVMKDRLRLTRERISAMAEGIRALTRLPDPVGRVLSEETRPNGLKIEKRSIPMGVIGIIYESRPNVTSDAAALALKAGSCCMLRCGRDAWNSCHAVTQALKLGLEKAGLSRDCIQLAEDTSRESAREMMTADGLIDLLIPRGGKGLIQACVSGATVPCIQTGTGICHVYVDETADLPMALSIIRNAKTSRPSVCNAQEVCLVHRKIAGEFLPMLRSSLVEERLAQGLPGVELRLSPEAAGIIPGTPAGEQDFDTEFLDLILAVGIVENVEEAIAHIAAHSTHHSEAIIAREEKVLNRFALQVDSAAVYLNASTRFTDGGEFGLGCEMGISTQKLHARGPMGLSELCTYKYVIRGNGQIR